MSLILDSTSKVESLVKQLRNSKKKIALCHGVFDVLQPGHIDHLYQSSKIADVLIVSVTSDDCVDKDFGDLFFDLKTRMISVSRVKGVDYVVPSNHATALENLSLIKPDFYVKGLEYSSLSSENYGTVDQETRFVSAYGGIIKFTNDLNSNSTLNISSSQALHSYEVREWIKKFKESHNLIDIFHWLDELQSVSVNVLGETIVDVYTSCKPLSKSSKDPILAFQRFDTKKFPGGVLAIGDSCGKWSKKTRVLTACGEDIGSHMVDFNNQWSFEFNPVRTEESPTIVKHRYYDLSSSNRVFEYYDFNPETLSANTQLEIIKKIGNELHQNSLFLLADYGHGFFGDILIDKLTQSKSFLAVNTQANAGNRGFNTLSKYPRIDFLSLNGGELELELRQKNLDYQVVVPQIMSTKRAKHAVVTLGANGLLTFDKDGQMSWTPALAAKVVDRVGAGDSVLAMASMLAFLGAPRQIIGLLSSLVAAFEVSQLGHAKSLDIMSLKKYAKSLIR